MEYLILEALANRLVQSDLSWPKVGLTPEARSSTTVRSKATGRTEFAADLSVHWLFMIKVSDVLFMLLTSIRTSDYPTALTTRRNAKKNATAPKKHHLVTTGVPRQKNAQHVMVYAYAD